MRFLLYNIRYAAGIGKKIHLPLPYSGYLKKTDNQLIKIVEFIKSAKPDIIGLVEVDSGSFRSNNSNQAEYIADTLHYNHIFQSKYSRNSAANMVPVLNKQGNAVLAKNKILSNHFHYFNEGVKRLVIETELEDLTILLVHLSLKYRHRQYQLQHLYKIIKKINKPLILAGDFNAFMGTKEHELFLAATHLKSANCFEEPSHPSRSPKRHLDYIFFSKEIKHKDFQIPQITLSDHVPLIFDFEIKK